MRGIMYGLYHSFNWLTGYKVCRPHPPPPH
jgi:hypothetical protein